MLALDNIYHANGEGSSTVLISFDLSTAFYTIDHTILLSRLQTSFGISGLALAWFHSYLEGRSQFVRIGCSTSPVTLCTTGVAQGSVLDPVIFSIFISLIAHIVSSHGLLQHEYAAGGSSMSPYPKTIAILQSPNSNFFLSTLHTWFCYNGLALNPDKSEATVFGAPSAHVLFQLPLLSIDVARTLVQVTN